MEIYKNMKEYMESYDKNNPKIALKIKHTYSVVAQAKAIATSLQLEQEEIDLACTIALLHDIGRFEQLRRYNSFVDHLTIDHALLGVQLLFEDRLIEEFISTREYDDIIYYAIKNHNKLEIESGLNERTIMHSKIIRDADKLDNLEIKCTSNFDDIYGATKEEIASQTISKKVYDSLMQQQQINSTHRETKLDMWLTHVGFVFDFNYVYSLEQTKKHNYVSIILHQIDCKDELTRKQIKEIEEVVEKYLEDRINES